MLMPLTHRRAVYEELFRSGVMVCEKNKVHKLKGHAYVTLARAAAADAAATGAAPVAGAPGDVPRMMPTGGASVAANRTGAKSAYIPNLHVIQLMRSLKSRGLVKEQFAWHHYYWWLTNEGIEFLRAELHLPAEIVPATLKRAQRAPDMPGAPGGPGGRFGDRDRDGGGYRGMRDRGDAEGGYRRAGAGPAPDSSKMADVGPGGQGQPSFRGGYGRGRGFGGDRGGPGGAPGGPGGAPGGPGGAPSGPGSWRQ